MTADEFVKAVAKEAERQGYPVEDSRNGQQLVFSNGKKLHEGHLRRLYPGVLAEGASISALIDAVAPGDHAATVR